MTMSGASRFRATVSSSSICTEKHGGRHERLEVSRSDRHRAPRTVYEESDGDEVSAAAPPVSSLSSWLHSRSSVRGPTQPPGRPGGRPSSPPPPSSSVL
ncbi:hypothetical protein EYF80_060565 [Liparis tanakae]|uniref:Uncharacterized protein n=1 Tax=Liparis tanakae TaxID=230148 RepID=A0A4Z2EKQ2_9TELE|nr:hypothetical protein EYF80_060565 [Liparis tanakae]